METSPDRVLIDTWWNVNVFKKDKELENGEVLIDTWWNVNNFPIKQQFFDKHVLIDTWWNVNKEVEQRLTW